jgi:hypothetical protein
VTAIGEKRRGMEVEKYGYKDKSEERKTKSGFIAQKARDGAEIPVSLGMTITHKFCGRRLR